MNVTEGFEAHCESCDAEYMWSVKDPNRRQENAHLANRQVWADTHYLTTGHHSFRFTRVSERTVSVAKIADPNQFSLPDVGFIPFGAPTFVSEQPGVGEGVDLEVAGGVPIDGEHLDPT